MDRAHFERRDWLGLLARAPLTELERHWQSVGEVPPFEWLRRPESGLVMVRARSGGTGTKFNLGEMTVTRCALRTGDGATGIGWVAGRSQRHAEIVALADALLQRAATRARVDRLVLDPLRAHAKRRAAADDAQAEATRVRFFTVVRGE